MKKSISFLILFFIITSANAQFGSLTKKIREKVNNKLETIITKKTEPTPTESTNQTDILTSDEDINANSIPKNAKGTIPEQKPIAFPKTGKFDLASKLTYAVDYDFFLQHQLGRKAIAIARNKGLTGTDKEVFDKARIDSVLVKKIWNELMLTNLPSDAQEIEQKFQTAGVFEAMVLASTSVLITDKHIKSTINGIGATNQKPLFLVGFQIDGFGLVDLQNNTSKNVGTLMGVPYTMIDSDFNVNSIFSMAKLGEDYMQKEGAKSEVILNKKAFGYNCNIARVIAPVKPVKKGTNNTDDSSLWFHCLLNNNFDDLLNKNYNPKYQIIVELYFTHDLDNILPKSLTSQKNKLNVDGFFVGAIVRDETGHGVTYNLQDIKPFQKVDSGEFKIPPGYPTMTQDELTAKVLEKMKNGGN